MLLMLLLLLHAPQLAPRLRPVRNRTATVKYGQRGEAYTSVEACGKRSKNMHDIRGIRNEESRSLEERVNVEDRVRNEEFSEASRNA